MDISYYLIAIQGLFLFAVAMGITAGGILGFTVLLFRSRKSGVYGSYAP